MAFERAAKMLLTTMIAAISNTKGNHAQPACSSCYCERLLHGNILSQASRPISLSLPSIGELKQIGYQKTNIWLFVQSRCTVSVRTTGLAFNCRKHVQQTFVGAPTRTTRTPHSCSPSTRLSVAALVSAQARIGPKGCICRVTLLLACRMTCIRATSVLVFPVPGGPCMQHRHCSG